MNVLVLFASRDPESLDKLQKVLKTDDIQLNVHQVAGHWQESTELLDKLSLARLIILFFTPEDVDKGWSHFVSGYCLGRECGFIVLNHNEADLPSFLTSAVHSGDLNEIKKELQRWKEIDQREKAAAKLHSLGLYVTPYHFIRSVQKNEKNVVETFLAAGVSPDTRDEKGVPALCAAVREDLYGMTDLLINAGCDINAVAPDRNNTALMDACANGNLDIVRRLVELDADLEVESKNEQTALMLAVGIGHAEIARLLFQAGADREKKDVLGMSSYTYAKILKHQDIVDLFDAED